MSLTNFRLDCHYQRAAEPLINFPFTLIFKGDLSKDQLDLAFNNVKPKDWYFVGAATKPQITNLPISKSANPKTANYRSGNEKIRQ